MYLIHLTLQLHRAILALNLFLVVIIIKLILIKVISKIIRCHPKKHQRLIITCPYNRATQCHLRRQIIICHHNKIIRCPQLQISIKHLLIINCLKINTPKVSSILQTTQDIQLFNHMPHNNNFLKLNSLLKIKARNNFHQVYNHLKLQANNPNNSSVTPPP